MLEGIGLSAGGLARMTVELDGTSLRDKKIEGQSYLFLDCEKTGR
jgi:hypothetical protein